jgi:hypothetical protein
MSSIQIPDALYERLCQRAAEQHISVEEMVTPLLDGAANGGIGRSPRVEEPASFAGWKEQFDAWMAEVQTRAARYPAGFVLDDSRESMYEGPDE